MTGFPHETPSRQSSLHLEIAAAQIAEVRRRIAQVESGEVVLVPGDEALARVRQLVASAKVGGENGQLRNLRH